MRILNVSGFDIVGATANGYLLHKEYNKRGHDSHMAVLHKLSADHKVHPLGRKTVNLINSAMARIERRLALYSVLPSAAFSLHIAPYFRTSEIVHLHLPHVVPFFSVFNFPLLGIRDNHRVVLSIHDMWMMTGACHYSLDCDHWLTGCGNCPDLSRTFPLRFDTTSFQWMLKKWAMLLSKITLIVGSDWQYDKVRRSPILSHLPCHRIPYGADTSVFKLRNKEKCRSRFNIPQEANVIAFRSVPWRKNFKGTEYIERALATLSPDKPTYLLTFEGKGGLDCLRVKYKFVELGWTNDQDMVADALAAADVLLMPSTAEAFGLMAIESMACGTPVIVFEGTALPQTIRAPHAGIAVPQDHEALAQATKTLLDDPDLRHRLADNGRKLVEQEHNVDLYVHRHLALYERLLKGDNV